MPEEKKKDSFTFSDKIKNSKPVPSKSFANRISSKIGSDGKPKKTLFERTRRDAPFFIAALVALLLLPFLYKYSGQVSEEPVVFPGSEESIFDPERYGFDTATGDPDGQIEQLAGRDPLSLIKGFGSQDENTADARYDQQVDRSGLSDDDSYNSSTVEENNTNIYKRQAAPATRAAFRRAATKINKIDSASMAGRSGGKLGVGMWGGNLKSAAKKVGSSAPRTSPKPVSLQPLQAAGKPSRSYFGQGAAAEARRSKDAMSKANAMQALRDAAMKPVEPGKIGGLGGGAFGPGGGNGKLDRNFVWNGKEPWWWDMMKKRSQMEWEKKFNRHWNWIEWGDKLAQKILGGILNCLITGKDDGGMGNLFGTVEGAGDADKCGKMTQKDWDACPECQKYGSKMTKAACQTLFGYTPGDKNKVDPWKGGDKANADLNFFQVRWDCLTEGFGKRSKGKSEKGEVDSDCEGLKTSGVYTASYSSQKGEDRKFFSYVVGIPTDKLVAYYQMQPTEQRKQWVVGAVVPGTTLNLNLLKDRKNFVPLFVESVAVKPKKVKNDGSKVKTNKDVASVLTEASTKKDEQKKLTYDALIATLADGGAFYDTRDDIAADSKAADSKAADSNTDATQGTDTQVKATKGTATFDLKGGKKGKDWIVGGRCQVPFARVTCENFALTGPKGKEIYPFAHIQFANGVTKNKDTYNTLAKKFRIVYKVLQGDDYGKAWKNDHETGVYIIPHNGVEKYDASWFKGSETTGDATSSRAGWVTYKDKDNVKNRDAAEKFQVIAAGEKALVKELTDSQGNVTNRDVSRVIKWEIYQCDNAAIAGDALADGGCDNGLWPKVDKDGNVIGTEGQKLPGVVLSTAVCEYGRSGDDESAEPPSSEPMHQNVDACDTADAWQKSEECCKKKKGSQGYVWKDGACVTQSGDPSKKDSSPEPKTQVTFLAPKPSWVPKNITARTGGDAPTQEMFSGTNGGNFLQGDAGQNCDIMDGFIVNSNLAKAYVNEVVQAYNDRNPNLPMKTDQAGAYAFSGKQGFPTVGEMIDAMNIASKVGKPDVPKQIVCAFGRTVMGASEDHTVPDDKWPTYNGKKVAPRNPFGSFLDYIGQDAAYWPAPYYIDIDGEEKCDNRFLHLGWQDDGKQSCEPSGVKGKYHWGVYASNAKPGPAYLKSSVGGKAGYPLAELDLLGDYQAIGNSKNERMHDIRLAYHLGADYKREDTNGGMNAVVRDTRESSSPEIFKGDACTHIYGDPDDTMQVANVLKYIQAVCTNGLDAKPQGNPEWLDEKQHKNRGTYRNRNGKVQSTATGAAAMEPDPNKK